MIPNQQQLTLNCAEQGNLTLILPNEERSTCVRLFRLIVFKVVKERHESDIQHYTQWGEERDKVLLLPLP